MQCRKTWIVEVLVKRWGFYNKWHDYCTFHNMFKGFNMNSYTRSYNFGYLSIDDRLKGNDTNELSPIINSTNTFYSLKTLPLICNLFMPVTKHSTSNMLYYIKICKHFSHLNTRFLNGIHLDTRLFSLWYSNGQT